LLTLVVVPVVYCYMDDLSEFLKRLWFGKQNSEPDASIEAKM
jgi:HAE1 family hydrophobic/amphiphilic exporter-1